jgi:hypothetical protein
VNTVLKSYIRWTLQNISRGRGKGIFIMHGNLSGLWSLKLVTPKVIKGEKVKTPELSEPKWESLIRRRARYKNGKQYHVFGKQILPRLRKKGKTSQPKLV